MAQEDVCDANLIYIHSCWVGYEGRRSYLLTSVVALILPLEGHCRDTFAYITQAVLDGDDVAAYLWSSGA